MSRRRIATLTVVSILMATVRMEAKAGEGNTPTRDGGQTLRLWQDDTATQETKNTYVDACVNMKAYEMLGVNPQGADPGEFREWSHDSRPGLSPYKDKRGVIIVGGKGEAAAGEGRSPLTGTRRVQTRTTAVEPEVPWRQGGTAQALQTAEAQQWPPQAEEAQLASTGAPELQGSTARAPRTGGGRSPLTETRRVQTRTTAVEPEVPGLWDGAVQATRTAEAQQWPPQAEEAQLTSTRAPELQGSTARAPRAGKGRSPHTGTRRVQTRTTAVEPGTPWQQGGTARALQTAEAQQWPPQTEETQLTFTGAPWQQGGTARAPRAGKGRSPLTETRRVQTRTTAVEPGTPWRQDSRARAPQTAEALRERRQAWRAVNEVYCELMHRAGNGTWRTGAQEDRTWAALQLPGVGPWAARASINTLQDPITNFFAEQLNPTIAGNRNAGGTDEQVERIGAALGGIRGGLRGRSIPSIQVELERHITDAKTSRRMSAAIDIVNRGIREHMIELGMDPDGDDEQMVAAMAWNMIHAEVVTIVDNNPNRRAAETQAAQLIQTRGQALVQRAQQVVDTHTLLGLFDTTTQLTEQVGDRMRERGADMTLVWAVTGNVVCTLADAYERGGRESARLDVRAVIDEAIDGVIELPE